MNNDDLRNDYYKQIDTNLRYRNLSISQLVAIDHMITWIKLKNYDSIINEVIEMKTLDVIERITKK